MDVKPVREALGTAYLAVLEAINEFLLTRGFSKKELPKSVEAYSNALRRHHAVHNGKIVREFEKLYDELPAAGYYRELLYDVNVVRDALVAPIAFRGKIH